MRLPLAVVAALCLSPAAAIAQAPATLSAWQMSNGTGVQFEPLTPYAVDTPVDLTDETRDHAYKYAIDTSALAWNPDCTCYRYYVIYTRAMPDGPVVRHKFKAIPSGSFRDQRVRIRLSIVDAAGTHWDDIALPVASAPGLEPSPLVEVKPDKPLQPVSLGGMTVMSLTLNNPSSEGSVEVGSDVLITPQDVTLWKGPPRLAAGTQLPLVLGPHAKRTIRVELEPIVKRAVGMSFKPTSKEVPHTSLRIEVPYASQAFAGRETRTSVEVPMRLTPSLATLGLWLLMGVAVGSLVPFFTRGKASVRKWATGVGAAAVASVILELFGMLLAQQDSKFVLMGFDLDPWQTTPVMFLGILAGLMGTQSVDMIQDRLRKKPPAPAAAATAILLVAGVLAWPPAVVDGQARDPRSMAAPQRQMAVSGPVAIGVAEPRQAAVLLANGRVSSIDVLDGRIGPDMYRVPGTFDAVDLAAGRTRAGAVFCLTLNPHSQGGPSYILQVFADKHEVWTYLMTEGVYVGLAIDSDSGVAYATNSSNNVVYRVQLGQTKGAVREVVTLPTADRIGAIAVDPAGKRLFVADLGTARIHTVALDTREIRQIPLPGVNDIRALAWQAADRRLYVADSGRETVWSVDPVRGAVEPAFKDGRFRAPAGLAVAPDGALWMVDEGAVSAFQLSTAARQVLRAVSWRRLD